MEDILFVLGISLMLLLKITAIISFGRILGALSNGNVVVRLIIFGYQKIYNRKTQKQQFFIGIGFHTFYIVFCVIMALCIIKFLAENTN